MAIVKHVHVLSVAKIYALLLMIVGFLEGIAIAVSTATGMAMSDQSYPFLQLGYAAIIVMPILYAILGFAVGSIGALLYNAFAKLVGGVEVDLELNATHKKRK